MAARKSSRLSRSRPVAGSPHRKRPRLLPLLEGLESRVVLSRTPSLMPPSVAELTAAAIVSTTDAGAGLIPVRLASGAIAWMEGPGTRGRRGPSAMRAWRVRRERLRGVPAVIVRIRVRVESMWRPGG
jgi:hypothetical protein